MFNLVAGVVEIALGGAMIASAQALATRARRKDQRSLVQHPNAWRVAGTKLAGLLQFLRGVSSV